MKIERTNETLDKQTNFHFDNLYFNNPQLYASIALYQIGDLSCKGGYVVAEHEQVCYEISYIVSGKGFFYIDEACYPVQEGDIVLNIPGQLHYCKSDAKEPFRFFYVGFDIVNSTDKQNPLIHIKKMFNQTLKPVVPNKHGIEVPFTSIFNELINLKNYSALMIEMYLRQIIVLAYRNFYNSWAIEYVPCTKGEEPKQTVYEVINHIDINLHQITELTQIADELHYSYSYLSHIFSKEVGLTIKEYYNHKRFEKAVEWLKSGELNVTQIADKLQYQSIHTFSKAFRKNFGISPTEYQTLSMKAKKEQ